MRLQVTARRTTGGGEAAKKLQLQPQDKPGDSAERGGQQEEEVAQQEGLGGDEQEGAPQQQGKAPILQEQQEPLTAAGPNASNHVQVLADAKPTTGFLLCGAMAGSENTIALAVAVPQITLVSEFCDGVGWGSIWVS